MPPLTADTVQVWSAAIEGPTAEALLALLAPAERADAARHVRPADRARAGVARGLLRRVAGALLGVAPEAVPAVHRPGRRPQVGRAPGAPDLRVGLAHSGDLVLCAVALGREVGVDVEALRPVEDAAALVARHFAPQERAAFAATPEAGRDAAFLRAWTRKEAALKGSGVGLAAPLREVVVPPGACPPETVVWTPAPAGGAPLPLRLVDLAPAPGYAAALAYEGTPATVAVAHWVRAEDGPAEHDAEKVTGEAREGGR